MIYLDGLPEPPEHSTWWDPTLLAQHVVMGLSQFIESARDMRDSGGTKEDWEYLTELTRRLALRAWDEIEGNG